MTEKEKMQQMYPGGTFLFFNSFFFLYTGKTQRTYRRRQHDAVERSYSKDRHVFRILHTEYSERYCQEEKCSNTCSQECLQYETIHHENRPGRGRRRVRFPLPLSLPPTSQTTKHQTTHRHLIEFTIDVEEPCTVCVMWSCEERLDPKTNVTRGFKFAKASKFMRFEKGIGQKVRTKAYPESVSGRSESFALKEMNLKTHQCSLVIVLTSPSDEREREDGTNEFVVSKQKCQITYAAIGKIKDGECRAVITQQKMHLNGMCYDLFEIYGIKGGQDEMCVVCMSECKEVAVLPCRYVYICSFVFIYCVITHHVLYKTGICVYVQSVFKNFECNPVSVRFVEIEFKRLCTSRVRMTRRRRRRRVMKVDLLLLTYDRNH